MKRLFLILFALLLLTACQKAEEVPAAPEIPEEVEVTQEVTATEPTVEAETQIVTPDLPEETVTAAGGVPVSYTSESVEGLVEDTVGYTFEIPVFDVPGAEAIREHYEGLVASMERYTKDTVYTNAMSRSCIVSVYSYVTEAVLEEDILTVTYVYECDYSDTDESEETVRTDSFSAATGEMLGN